MSHLIHRVLCGNVFDHIIAKKYISIKDIYCLSLVNKTLHKRLDETYIMNGIKDRITLRLQKIFSVGDYKTFTDIMEKSRAILSGSFIIQCILNEYWDNSDIDIYVGNYKGAKQFSTFLKDKACDIYDGNYNVFGSHIRDIVNFKVVNNGGDETVVQIVMINVTKDYSLSDHNRNTGFEICKNILYFNRGEMVLKLQNLKETIHKVTTFTILDIDDFFFRIEKYSKRGFHFKPKYHKMLYLEYIILKFSHTHIIEPKKRKWFSGRTSEACGVNCPIKLLFRNVRHHHSSTYDLDEDTCCSYKKYLRVENTDGTFDCILSQLLSSKPEVRQDLEKAVKWNCKNIDDYAKIRNQFVKHKSRRIKVRDTSGYKYDVQFGLPNLFTNQKPNLFTNQKPNLFTNQKPKQIPQQIQQKNQQQQKNPQQIQQKNPQKKPLQKKTQEVYKIKPPRYKSRN